MNLSKERLLVCFLTQLMEKQKKSQIHYCCCLNNSDGVILACNLGMPVCQKTCEFLLNEEFVINL